MKLSVGQEQTLRGQEQMCEHGEWVAGEERDTHTLPCIKQMASGSLQVSTGSSAWCAMVPWRAGVERSRFKRNREYVYTEPIHFVVRWKPIQHCKPTITQLKEKNKKTFMRNL